MEIDSNSKSWWHTLPGIITATTGFIAALTGLIAILAQVGVLTYPDHHPTAQLPFPDELNILIFNASSSPTAHEDLKNAILSVAPKSKIDAKLEWDGKFLMTTTRIYYLNGEYNQAMALLVSKWMPGPQRLIDYEAQNVKENPSAHPLSFPDSPSNNDYMFGFNKDRNLAIFIGNDYPVVLSQ